VPAVSTSRSCAGIGISDCPDAAKAQAPQDLVKPTILGKEEQMITEVIQELDRRGLEYELLPHERTQTARAEARAVGVAAREVAKTVVLTTDGGYVRVVVPASERLDLAKARDLLDDRHSRLATEEELGAAYPAFELGAVPPFAGPSGDKVIVDRVLAEQDEIVLEAGSHDQSVKMRTSDLLALSGAEVADISA
jgi:Ala-tRNA(Pro) deacylase